MMYMMAKVTMASVYILGWCISYSSVVVMKYHNQSNLWKEGLIWAYGSRGIRIHFGKEAWQPVAS